MRIVELPSSVPILTLLFGRLKLTMLGVRFRTLRYVWNSAKPLGTPRAGLGIHKRRFTLTCCRRPQRRASRQRR